MHSTKSPHNTQDWTDRTQEGQCLVERIYRVGNALLSLKEQEYLGQSHTGELDERLTRLINHLLAPLESEWLGGTKEGAVILRVKELRRAILPAMIDGNLAPAELDRSHKRCQEPFLAKVAGFGSFYLLCSPMESEFLQTLLH